MSDDLERARREARPDNLASLRRLDAALQRANVRWEGKTVREWLAVLVEPHSPVEALTQVLAAGLGAVPALLEALAAGGPTQWGESERERQLEYLAVLDRLDPEPRGAIPALLALLGTPSTRVRRMLLAMLAKLRPRPTPAALRAILSCLEDRRDEQVRARAAQVLSRLDGPIPVEVRDAVLARLGDSQRWVRRFAIAVLGRVTPPDAALAVALEEQALLDDDNRTEALSALLAHSPGRALSLLVDVARNAPPRPSGEPSPRADSAVRALRVLGAQGARAAAILPDLWRLKSGALPEAFIDATIDDILRDELRRGATTPPSAARPSERAVAPRPTAKPVDARWVSALQAELPAPLSPTERPVDSLVRWALACAGPWTEARVRIVLAAARRVVGFWDDEYPDDAGPRQGLEALEQWVCDPTEEAARHARRAASLIPSQLCAPAAFAASWALTHASFCIPVPDTVEPQDSDAEGQFLKACLRSASNALSAHAAGIGALGASQRAPESLPPSEAVRVLHGAIQDEVLPWALGTWDPVKDVRRERMRRAPTPS